MKLEKRNAIKFYKPHQYTTIQPGSSGRVYYMKVPESCVAFIERIGNNYFDNTYYKVYIDGELMESNVIERQIAPINQPLVLVEPILVKNYIEVIGYNNDTSSHIMEFLIDGTIYHLEDTNDWKNI